MNGNEEVEELEKIKKMVLKKILSREALERLGRVKLVKPETATQLELYLIQLYQSGKIQEEISDEQLKNMLNALTSKNKFKILK